MPVNECIELYPVGKRVTCHAEAAVTGKRFVAISDDRIDGNYAISPAAAGVKAFGVAAADAAAGEKVGTFGAGDIVPVTAGAALTAGTECEVGANGTAIPLATGKAVGYVCVGAALNADAEIRLYA